MSNDVSLDVNNNLRVVNYHVSYGLSPMIPSLQKTYKPAQLTPMSQHPVPIFSGDK